MKPILMLFLLSIQVSVLAQPLSHGYAVVEDADGYVNLRVDAHAQAKVLAAIPNGTPLSCSMDQSDNPSLCAVALDGRENFGFIHRSRLVFLDQDRAFTKVALQTRTQHSAVYQEGQVKVKVSIAPVALDKKGYATKTDQHNVMRTMYQGQIMYGTDNEIIDAAYGYADIQVTVDGHTAQVPQSQLTSLIIPTYSVMDDSVFDHVSVYYHPQRQHLYVFSTQADGAAMYTAVFEFKNHQFVRKSLWLASM